jgi:competence ComEA-like helix-hairpin-helix protein
VHPARRVLGNITVKHRSPAASNPAIRPGWLIAAGAIVLGATIASASAPSQSVTPAKPAAKPVSPVLAKSVGDLTPAEEEEFSKAAEDTIERVCILCHPFENIVKTRRTVREWNDQVTTMAQRGAPGTEPDFALIKKYLTRYYGIVRVNTATADELTSVLGLSPKAAAAVVEYRTAHGKFADLDGLAKVEGVDKAKLEEQPEALRFD